MLAVIAGAGALPGIVARAQVNAPLICALEGFVPDDVPVDLTFRIETLGSLIATLHRRGVQRICFAGVIRRPAIDPASIDAATLPLVEQLHHAIAQGDDGALRVVIGLFETAGFVVRSASDLVPGLLPPPGVLGKIAPGPEARADAKRGEDIVRHLSGADIGQGCAVLNGQALALEGVFGTDWMLASLAARPDAGGGLLFKATKAGQDTRADQPSIGPATADAVTRAGLAGIVVEAGSVLVLEREALIDACDQAGLFLWVRERGR